MDTEQLLPPSQLSTAELTAAFLGAHENWCRDYLRILELFAEVEHRGLARELGYRNTITWATATFNISTHDAKARLRHALALIPSVSRVVAPIEGASDWNHLSVRSAAAILLDRMFGRGE